MQIHWKHMAMIAVSLALLGCGEAPSTDGAQKQALQKISQYAESDGHSLKPTLEDYQAAGIHGVDGKNIDTMNKYITYLDGENIDELSEIQETVDHLDELAADDDGDGTPNGVDDDRDGDGIPNDTDPEPDEPAAPDEDDDTPSTVNHAPTAKDLAVATQANVVTTIELFGQDPDGDSLTYQVKESPSHGSFANNKYTPVKDYIGVDTFTYIAKDAKVSSAPATVTIQVKPNIEITKGIQVESLGQEKTIHQIIDIGDTAKTLYVLLSNSDPDNTASASIAHNAKKIAALKSEKRMAAHAPKRPIVRRTPDFVHAFNAHVDERLKQRANRHQAKTITPAPKQEKNTGASETFYLKADTTDDNITATLKKVVSDVSTNFGSKTLNVWVANNAFEGNCDRAKCVTQDMVDALANTFLKTGGNNNDIYDWVTNIYGEEWGRTGISNLIGDNDEITILLLDIGDDNSSNGGTIGYFYSKDNFTKSSASGSNERIMFYADSVMFANDANGGFWQREMYSTLAHEFQHMIHFYQKTVKRGTSSDVWINEMLSEATEYLVSTKIGHTTPRGVPSTDGSAGDPGITLGRYNNEFNAHINDFSLSSWGVTVESDYGKVSAFGAYLVNNYGGAKVLHDILDNNLSEEDAIEKATGKSFGDLLRDWGAAVLLSDKTEAEKPYIYNTGDFTESVYGESTIAYKMGSISFFNYATQPDIRAEAGTVQPQGNYYYKIGDNLTGKVVVDINLSSDMTEATLIAK